MNGRLLYLDGVRGIAALSVVVYHFFCVFVPVAIPDQTASLAAITDTPVGLLYNGPFAVMVFFVLSGLVVSNAASKSKDSLIVSLVARYVRLAVPATVSLVVAGILLALMPDVPRQLASAIPHPWFTANRIHLEGGPLLRRSLHTEVFQAFKYGGPGLNPVLWTMQFELVGSCCLYVCYRAVGDRFRIPILALSAAACQISMLFPSPHWLERLPSYTGFFVGALLFEYWSKKRLPSIAPLKMFLVGGLLGAMHAGFHARMKLATVWHQFVLGNHDGVLYAVGAAMMIYGCIQSRELRWVFSLPPMKLLGRISFSLYLIHVPLLITGVAAIYLHWLNQGVSGLLLLFLIFLLASVLMAIGLTFAVDEPVLRSIAWLKRAIRMKQERGSATASASYV